MRVNVQDKGTHKPDMAGPFSRVDTIKTCTIKPRPLLDTMRRETNEIRCLTNSGI